MDTLEQFQKIRNSLVQERQRLDSRLKEINKVLGDGGMPSTISQIRSVAAKARWAKLKANSNAMQAPKAKRKMSAAAKKKMSEVARARWAKAKAAGKKKL